MSEPISLDERRVSWRAGSHERKVERFYSIGAQRFGDCHGGYLNFGLWEREGCDYIAAAENLVATLALWGDIGAGSRVLDVGCGFGAQDVFLAENFAPGAITGLDLTWPHVLAARKRAAEAGLGREVQFQHGSATDLRGFPAGSFTHALAVEGIVHFDTRRRFFREAHRVLEPGGSLLIADYALQRPPRSLLDRLCVMLVRRGWSIPRDNCDTVGEYAAKLAAEGFAEVEIRRVGALTIPQYVREQRSPAYRRRLRDARGLFGLWGGDVIDWFARWMYERGQLEYVLVRARKPA
jgi:microcystin synthetase protein McyJ